MTTRATVLLSLLAMAALAGCDKEEEVDSGDDTGETGGGGDDTGETGGEGLLSGDFEADLPGRMACSDSRVHAWSAADDVGLTFWASGVLAQAIKDGGLSQTYDLATDLGGISLEVEVTEPGQASINYCTDALSERTVRATYTASVGLVALSIVPDKHGEGDATLTLTDVVLVDADGNTATVEALTLEGIHILTGWGG